MIWKSTKLTLTLVKGRALTGRLANPTTCGTTVNVRRNVVIIGPAGSTSEPSIWAFLSTTALLLGVAKGMTKKTPSFPTSGKSIYRKKSS